MLTHGQAYRSESFYRAAELYQELASQKTVHDSDSDLRINGGATDAQLTWAGQAHLVKKIKPDREDLEHFETAYNAACGYTARGEFKQAELLLSRATGAEVTGKSQSCANRSLQIYALQPRSSPTKTSKQSCYP